MKDVDNARMREELQHLAAEFINLESNRLSLITVTGVFLSEDGKKAKVFCSVYPKDREGQVLDFLMRKRPELRSYIKKHGALRILPFFDFALAPDIPLTDTPVS
jgi:ribosome-binding factor A